MIFVISYTTPLLFEVLRYPPMSTDSAFTKKVTFRTSNCQFTSRQFNKVSERRVPKNLQCNHLKGGAQSSRRTKRRGYHLCCRQTMSLRAPINVAAWQHTLIDAILFFCYVLRIFALKPRSCLYQPWSMSTFSFAFHSLPPPTKLRNKCQMNAKLNITMEHFNTQKNLNI